LVYGHRIFEDIAASLELPGMPHFLRRDDVAATYESLTGHTPRDLDFYGTYAALQYGIVFLRTGHRQVHFGEIEMPADVDDLIMNREPLERMLAGAYWT
jgi:aminoglycoside phosphotransferase (APT) family kinase protein